MRRDYKEEEGVKKKTIKTTGEKRQKRSGKINNPTNVFPFWCALPQSLSSFSLLFVTLVLSFEYPLFPFFGLVSVFGSSFFLPQGVNSLFALCLSTLLISCIQLSELCPGLFTLSLSLPKSDRLVGISTLFLCLEVSSPFRIVFLLPFP